jgi:hypothetical protein
VARRPPLAPSTAWRAASIGPTLSLQVEPALREPARLPAAQQRRRNLEGAHGALDLGPLQIGRGDASIRQLLGEEQVRRPASRRR